MPSKTDGAMYSSTGTNATPRVLLQAPLNVRGGRYKRPRKEQLSSSTGLRGRPWVARLRRALAQDLFVLHFQPIVSLSDGAVFHHEALLRMVDESSGELIAPGRFLPAAERYGMIGEIDRMVLGKAASLLGSEPTFSGATIAMNVSGLSVTDGAMLSEIERSLARHGVDPSRLAIEVTETAAISDMRSARTFCAGVLDMGCSLALDDFGAGFGSFQYLKQLPFSHLKIDGDFIRNLPSSHTDQLVVRALARIVRGMGRETIAEFVGDAPTVSMLRAYDVDYAQGFHVGHPGPLLALAA